MEWIYKVLLTHSIAIAVSGVLVVSILRQPRKSLPQWALLGLLAGCIEWLIVNGISEWLTVRSVPSDLLGGFAGLGIQMMVVCAFILCETLGGEPGTKLERTAMLRIGLVLILSLIVASFSFSENYMGQRRVLVDGSTTADYRVWFKIAGYWAIIVTLIGLFRLYGNYARETDARKKTQIRLFILGIFISLCLTVIFSFVLPQLGQSDLFFLGVDSSIIFTTLMTYAILFLKMFDLRTALLRLLLRFVISASLSILLYVFFLVFILERNISDFSYDLALALSLFFIAVFFLAQRALPAVDRLLLGRPIRFEEFARKLFRITTDPGENLEDDLTEIFRILDSAPHFDSAWLMAVHLDGGYRLHRKNNAVLLPGNTQQLLQRLLRVEQLPTSLLSILDQSYLLDASPVLADSQTKRTKARLEEILNQFRMQGMRVFLPLVAGSRISGWLILGSRRDDMPYYARDMEFLDAVRIALGILLSYRRNLIRMQLAQTETRADLSRLTESLSSHKELETRTMQLVDRTVVYRSEVMHSSIERAEQIATATEPVLVTGETGTGKEIFARLVHQRSSLREFPFVAVNCAAITENLWEDELFGHVRGAFTDAKGDRAGRVREAGRGVLFLDEIGEMPLSIQARLLRLLQEGTFSPVGSDQSLQAQCRFIFATNRSIPEMIARGMFREDLYYRINVFAIHLPPLRERSEDIPVLIEYYRETLATNRPGMFKSIDSTAMNALTRYGWPGNVRELENFIVRCAALHKSETIEYSNLPVEMRNAPRSVSKLLVTKHEPETDLTLREMIDDHTRRIIIATLKKTNGNRTKAAQTLGVKRGSLLYRMKELGID
ncbi:MAG: sigma 54-interacting transcriptional regulator [Spirochaetia bacterium]|nr:sigma 54-interacting transcriptional regulator [Spirochaetia bacterium]